VIPRLATAAGTNENEYACSVTGDANVYGPLAIGVPGCLAGIGTIWERWGKLKWPQILAPTQKYVANGFPFSTVAAAVKSRAAQLGKFPASKEQFMPGGQLPNATDTWRRPHMDKTLARLAQAGWQDFYKGELGRKIADHVQALGGLLTRKDMQSFQVLVGEAHHIPLGQTQAFTAVLPNGGLSSLSALHMLQQLPVRRHDDPLYWHQMIEVLKIAWRDRFRYLGDPRHAKVPIERLLSATYAQQATAQLRKQPSFVDHTPGPPALYSPGTIHMSTSDAEGNLVSVTISHGGAFGSCVTVPDSGITLGHGMCRFDPHPGLPNSVAGGKRPMNNTCPTILLSPDRKVASGLSGGRRIVSVNTRLAYDLLHGMEPKAVLAAPRLHLEGYEPAEVTKSMPPAIVTELEKMGHKIKLVNASGGAANIAL
jgi:gamma-glutamyltranspeptidase/glutathione hydrolase